MSFAYEELSNGKLSVKVEVETTTSAPAKGLPASAMAARPGEFFRVEVAVVVSRYGCGLVAR